LNEGLHPGDFASEEAKLKGNDYVTKLNKLPIHCLY